MQQRVEIFPSEFSAKLLSAGVRKIYVAISGCGDSGEIDEICFWDSDGKPLDKDETYKSLVANGGGGFGRKGKSFLDEMELYFYNASLNSEASYDNDGGATSMTYSSNNDTFVMVEFTYIDWSEDADQ